MQSLSNEACAQIVDEGELEKWCNWRHRIQATLLCPGRMRSAFLLQVGSRPTLPRAGEARHPPPVKGICSFRSSTSDEI